MGVEATLGPAPAVPASRPRWGTAYVRQILELDLLIALCGVFVACWVEVFRGQFTVLDRALALLLAAGWPVALALAGAYEQRHFGAGREEFRRVTRTTVTLAATLGVGGYVTRLPVGRLFVLIAVVGTGLLLLSGRWAMRNWLHRQRRAGRWLHRVLAVGTPADVATFAAFCRARPWAGWQVIAACLPVGSSELDGAATVPVVGPPADAADLAAQVRADAIAVTNAAVLGGSGVRRLAWELEGSPTHLLMEPGLSELTGPQLSVKPLLDLPLLHVERRRPRWRGLHSTSRT